MPVSWVLERDELVVKLDGGRPTLNPEWMRAIRARTSWSPVAQSGLYAEVLECDDNAMSHSQKQTILLVEDDLLLAQVVDAPDQLADMPHFGRVFTVARV